MLLVADAMPLRASAEAAREGVRVGLFTTVAAPKPNRVLAADAAGLALLVAERLDAHPALRVVGPAALIDRTEAGEAAAGALPPAARFLLGGRLSRESQLETRVFLSLWERTPSGPLALVGTADVTCRRSDLPRATLKAVLEALHAGGIASTPATEAAFTAPFGRDPYAFVLYSRGVAALLGVDGRPASGERALPSFTRSMVIDPKVPETRRIAGLVHLDAGRPGHARSLWDYAVDLRPAYRAAWIHLADLDRTQGMASAASSYAKVLGLDPGDLAARRSLGELLAEAGRLEEAQSHLQQVVAAWPNDLRARRALALVLAARHAGDDLARELEAILRLDPTDTSASLELGAAYASLGRNDEALAVYDDVLKARPKNPVVLKIVADLWRQKGEAAKAIPLYEKLRRMDPHDPRPLFALGELHFRRGDLNQAERVLTEAAQLPGMLGDAYGDLGAVALARGQVAEALRFLGKAAERRPRRALVHYNYGLALHQAGRDEDAARQLGEAIRLDDADASSWFAIGVVALKLHDLVQAEAAFRKVVALEPANEGARHNLALLAVALGRGSETAVATPFARPARDDTPRAEHESPAVLDVDRDGGRDH